MSILSVNQARRIRHCNGRMKVAAAAAAMAAAVSAGVGAFPGATGAAHAGPNDFTFIVLPDTQKYSDIDPGTFAAHQSSASRSEPPTTIPPRQPARLPPARGGRK